MQIFIKNQEVLYYQFEKEKNPAEVHQETIQQAKFMNDHEISYKMMNGNLIQFLQAPLKFNDLKCSVVKINQNEQLFVDIVYGIQFAYLNYFQQTPKNKRCESLLTSTCSICSSLLHNFLVHRSTYEQHEAIFNGPLEESFVPLSSKKNNFKIKSVIVNR